MSEPDISDKHRLPGWVDEARLVGGTARCQDCGYSVNYNGNETRDQARERWFSDEHKGRHDE